MITFIASIVVALSSAWCLIKGDMDLALYYIMAALFILIAGRY